MADHAVQPGRVLAGRFKLEDKLGEGGFGTIWRAEHVVLCAPVAVKIIDKDVSKDEEARARFMREARAAATLRSPHVVQILDYGVDEGLPFIAMELLEGETLAQRLERVGRLTASETVRFATHIGRAVARAHDAGIIHRDLKPENVFIVKNEDEEIVKVLDFGVAKMDTAELGPKGTRTRTGSLLGTPYYMSPEQAQGNKTIDRRSDLWALGVIVFECMTGKRPFESEGLGDLVLQICVRELPLPSELAPVPDGFDRWFKKACAREAEDRFQSARELIDALREAMGVESRETLATMPDSDTDASSGKMRVAPTPAVSARVPKTEAAAESGRRIETADTIVVTGTRKPAATLGQFSMMQTAEPKPASRTALIVSVGGLALAIGMGGGFMVLRRHQPPPVAAETAEPASETPSTAPPQADAASSEGEPNETDPSGVPTLGAAKADGGSDASATAADGRDASTAKGTAPPSASGKPDPKKADAGARPTSKEPRDWGIDRPDAALAPWVPPTPTSTLPSEYEDTP
jgi:serine/threonine-protein kinase